MRFGKNEILNLLGNKMIFCRTNLGLIVLLIWCLMIGMVFPKGSVKADSVYIDLERMDGENAGTPVGEIWAVDSWFLTLVTLNFKMSGVPDGEYDVLLYDSPNCSNPGDVYNPFGDSPGLRIGDLLTGMATENGTLTGIHGIKPPIMTADAHKLTVIEMRGHSLLLRAQDTRDTIACGIVREGEWEEPR